MHEPFCIPQVFFGISLGPDVRDGRFSVDLVWGSGRTGMPELGLSLHLLLPVIYSVSSSWATKQIKYLI